MIEPGEVIAERYRVRRLLGEGAMGAVYEAEHVMIGRRVALKVLHPRYTKSPEALRRFTREARAAAALGHPNIVAVTDFGSHARRPFLVMDLLRGETLADRMLHARSLPVGEACRVVGEVLSALAAAHAINIVHRDLKPENVFLCDDRAATTKLLDFGVSKFRPPGSVADHVTRDGTPIGTPNYMAPEQWTGQRDVDPRADLYAVGVILYELLTGALPFEGATEGVLYGVVVHGTAPPTPPSELLPELPPALDAVVLRAVSRDREARFQTAEAFLDALRPFGAEAEVLPIDAVSLAASNTPSDAPPPDDSGRARRAAAATVLDPEATVVPRVAPKPRGVARWAGAAVAAFLVAAGAFGVLRGRPAPPPPARRATAPHARTPTVTTPPPSPALAPEVTAPAPPPPPVVVASPTPPPPEAPRAAPTPRRRPSRPRASPRGTAMTREF